MERAGDLVDGHTIPMRPANGSVIVHRKHILNLRGVWLWSKKATLRGGCWGGSELGAHSAPEWVRFTRSFPAPPDRGITGHLTRWSRHLGRAMKAAARSTPPLREPVGSFPEP